jgi:16S rRNA (cytosine1402-N4)-methyltransferase
LEHVPVLLDEVRELLQPQRGGTFVDCTVGLGGHARMLLEHGATRLIGIDRDTEALALARAALETFGDRVALVHADYRDLDAVLDAQGVKEVAGVLADLGVSSMQLDREGRGFSFRRDEPLDMRMDRSQGETAAELIDRVDEKTLADAIYRFGEERRSRQVARAIVTARQQAPIETTGRLAEIVRRAVAARGRGPRRGSRGAVPWQRIDPATRTFQALRIWVNRELDGLDSFIGRAAARLQPAGRLAVISFHSLEDRVVKHTLRGSEGLQVLTKHPIVAGDAEAAANPRARSAKLRGAEKVVGGAAVARRELRRDKGAHG